MGNADWIQTNWRLALLGVVDSLLIYVISDEDFIRC